MKSFQVLLIVFISASFFSCKQKVNTPKQTSAVDKVNVELTAITASETEKDNFVMMFTSTSNSKLKLPITIGASDAQALVVAIEKISHPAPLPLELFEDLVRQSNFTIDEVLIDKVEDGRYTAEIHYTANRQHKILHSRCCDAVTLATKFECPILINKALLIQF